MFDGASTLPGRCSDSKPTGKSVGKRRVIPAVLPYVERPEEGGVTFPHRKVRWSKPRGLFCWVEKNPQHMSCSCSDKANAVVQASPRPQTDLQELHKWKEWKANVSQKKKDHFHHQSGIFLHTDRGHKLQIRTFPKRWHKNYQFERKVFQLKIKEVAFAGFAYFALVFWSEKMDRVYHDMIVYSMT